MGTEVTHSSPAASGGSSSRAKEGTPQERDALLALVQAELSAQEHRIAEARRHADESLATLELARRDRVAEAQQHEEEMRRQLQSLRHRRDPAPPAQKVRRP